MTKTTKPQQPSANNLRTVSSLSLVLTSISVLAIAFLSLKYVKLTKDYNELKTGFAMKVWQPHEEVYTPTFTITVEDVQFDKTGIPKYLPTPEGMQFVVVDISVRNNTDQDKLFVPIEHAYLKDQDHREYGLTTAPGVEQSIAGNVPAGDTTRGQIGFLVPVDVKHLNFYFEPYIDDAQTVSIDLSSYIK